MAVGKVLRVEDDGAVVVDQWGGLPETCDDFSDGGDDSPPLAGDYVALAEGVGTGAVQVTGQSDDTGLKAAPGEKRIYARDSSGAVVAEFWLRGDGSIEVISGKVRLGSGSASQSVLRGDDFLTYLDLVISAMSTALGGVPTVGAALKAAFDLAITAADTARAAALSQSVKTD